MTTDDESQSAEDVEGKSPTVEGEVDELLIQEPEDKQDTTDVSDAQEGAVGEQDAQEGAAPAKVPFGAIFRAVVAVIVALMLYSIAGNVSMQACVSKVAASYGTPTAATGSEAAKKSVGLTNLARKKALDRCSTSPF